MNSPVIPLSALDIAELLRISDEALDRAESVFRLLGVKKFTSSCVNIVKPEPEAEAAC